MVGKIFNDVFTERDSKTYCPVRILGVIGFFAYIFLAYSELIRHCQDFSLSDFSTGIGIILGVFAGGITIKTKTES